MAEVKLEDAPQGVQTFYDKGIAAMERANLDYAMDMFEAALHIEPRILQIRKLLRAVAIQKYKANPPGKLDALKGIAPLLKLSARKKSDPFLKLEDAEKLMRADPFNMKYAKALCDAAVAAEFSEAAIQTLEILKDHRPNELAVLEPLAGLYNDQELYKQEYDCRNRIVRLKPTDTAALKALKDAAAHNTMEKAGWDKAESYRDVMRESAEKKTNDPAIEIEDCLEKIEREPNNLNYRRTLANLYLQVKRYDDAIQILETCGSDDPQVERALIDARAEQVDHEIARAEEAGDTAHASKLRKKQAASRIIDAAERVKHYPNDLQPKFDYGLLLFESGRYTEAIQQFQLAQRNPQRRVRSLYYLARAFREKGQFDIALEQLETACGEVAVMDGTKKEILYELGSLCETMGNGERAVKFFKEIYSVDIGYRDVAEKVEETYRS
jgi:tetratricopeptide (TPR) repeat protein